MTVATTVVSRGASASVSTVTARQGVLPIGNEWLGINQILSSMHYLGPIKRGTPWRNKFGVLVLANPSSRRLPQSRWLELVRWCLFGIENGGSQQWAAVSRWLLLTHPNVTTVVSYSDPSVGHTGALYRACNWLWAPTWHRLRTPPSGNGKWTKGGKVESVKDRWVFCLQPDAERENLLRINDAALVRKYPWAEFREKRGGDYKRWRDSGGISPLSVDAVDPHAGSTGTPSTREKEPKA